MARVYVSEYRPICDRDEYLAERDIARREAREYKQCRMNNTKPGYQNLMATRMNRGEDDGMLRGEISPTVDQR